ncbi:hypothetical protein [Mesorhizobium denitrificans]|nr:hypothetical protein [Mesorhizobium denitrificans]
MTDVFEMIMDAQPSAGERFEAALRLVKTSDDPMTVASAALYAQKVVIGFCDPTFDLSKICTVNMARKHIEQMRRDPEVAERFNRYFVGI